MSLPKCNSETWLQLGDKIPPYNSPVQPSCLTQGKKTKTTVDKGQGFKEIDLKFYGSKKEKGEG